MKRRALLAALCLTTLVTVFGIGTWYGLAIVTSRAVQAEGVLGTSSDQALSSPLPYPVSTTNSPEPNIPVHYYAIYSPQSGKLLAGKDESTPVPIASTTKMMTAFVVSRIGSMDDVVTISKEAAAQPGSIMGLLANEKITIQNVLMGAMMVSGNDAAMTLGEYGGGILLGSQDAPHDAKVARFVEEMNKTAAALGMTNTHYMDPAGLNDSGHSSALDLAKLAHYAIESPVIKPIIGTAITTVTNVTGTIRHDLRNSNRLVADYFYQGVIGGKTGFTLAAGHCLISAAERDGFKVIVVVLNTYSTSLNASAQAAKQGLDWAFANWKLE